MFCGAPVRRLLWVVFVGGVLDGAVRRYGRTGQRVRILEDYLIMDPSRETEPEFEFFLKAYGRYVIPETRM